MLSCVAMSNDVMWQILRQHNSHVVKRDGIVLSGEPGNLLNLHSYKYSGLANNNIIHVSADKKDTKKIKLVRQQVRQRTKQSATGSSEERCMAAARCCLALLCTVTAAGLHADCAGCA